MLLRDRFTRPTLLFVVRSNDKEFLAIEFVDHVMPRKALATNARTRRRAVNRLAGFFMEKDKPRVFVSAWCILAAVECLG